MSNEKQYAENLNYWNTDVTIPRNQERIEKLLNDFQAEAIQIRLDSVGEKCLWTIRFSRNGRTYRLEYQPWPIGNRKYQNDPKRIAQAKRQMGSRAFHEIKALLIASAYDDRALFGYLEVSNLEPDPITGLPPRTSDVNMDQWCEPMNLIALPAPGDGD